MYFTNFTQKKIVLLIAAVMFVITIGCDDDDDDPTPTPIFTQIQITTPSPLVPGEVDKPYSFEFKCQNSTGTYNFTVVNGSLPVGMVLDGDGSYHGTPLTENSFAFDIMVKDAFSQDIRTFSHVITEKIPGGTGHPVVAFTEIPPYNSGADLKGQVLHVKPSEYKIAVYIKVGSGWWTKPYSSSPTTTISQDGTFICDVTTGGNDPQATRLYAFLILVSYTPPLLSGAAILPTEIYSKAFASMEIIRNETENYRILSFSGYEWRVKKSTGLVGPGPNYFSDSPENVWVDSQGLLHLKIRNEGNVWKCSEVILQKNLGYGTYTFETKGRVDIIDKNAVLGLFTWDDDPAQNHREIDIEISKWGQDTNQNSQFVVQPWTVSENMHRFNLQLPNTETITSHSFDWSSGSIFFQTLRDGSLVESWNYTGSYIPAPGKENARINLWLNETAAPSGEVEVVISNFTFAAR